MLRKFHARKFYHGENVWPCRGANRARAGRRCRWCGRPGSALNGDVVIGVLEDLQLGRTARRGFLLGGLPAPVLQFALVECHARSVAEPEWVKKVELAPWAAF